MTVTDQRELVAALLTVDGVADAALEQADGRPGAGSLRLLLRPGADEVGVATAVNRVLRDRFGLAVDSDRVEVIDELPTVPPDARALTAPSSPDSWTRSVPASPPRPERPDLGPARTDALERRPGGSGRVTIERIQLVTAGLGVTTSVTLALGARAGTGEIEGMASASGVHRSVANATLRAVEGLVGPAVRFELEHVEVSSTGAERTAIALVTMLTDRGSEALSGSSIVRGDQRVAVIRAVLGAVNRRIEPLLADRD